MTPFFKSGMAIAKKLTEAGRLHQASAMMRSLLQGPAQPVDDATEATDGRGQVIEGDFTWLDPAIA